MTEKVSIKGYGRKLAEGGPLSAETAYEAADELYNSGDEVLDERSLQKVRQHSTEQEFRKYLIKQWRKEGVIHGAYFEEIVDKARAQGKLDLTDEESRLKFANWLISDTEIHQHMNIDFYNVLKTASPAYLSGLINKYYHNFGKPLSILDYDSVSMDTDSDLENLLDTSSARREPLDSDEGATIGRVSERVKEEREKYAKKKAGDSPKVGLTPRVWSKPEAAEDTYRTEPGMSSEDTQGEAPHAELAKPRDIAMPVPMDATKGIDSLDLEDEKPADSAKLKDWKRSQTEIKEKRGNFRDMMENFQRSIGKDLTQLDNIADPAEAEATFKQVEEEMDAGLDKLYDQAAGIDDPTQRRTALREVRQLEAEAKPAFAEARASWIEANEQHQQTLMDIADRHVQERTVEDNIEQSSVDAMLEKDKQRREALAERLEYERTAGIIPSETKAQDIVAEDSAEHASEPAAPKIPMELTDIVQDRIMSRIATPTTPEREARGRFLEYNKNREIDESHPEMSPDELLVSLRPKDEKEERERFLVSSRIPPTESAEDPREVAADAQKEFLEYHNENQVDDTVPTGLVNEEQEAKKKFLETHNAKVNEAVPEPRDAERDARLAFLKAQEEVTSEGMKETVASDPAPKHTSKDDFLAAYQSTIKEPTTTIPPDPVLPPETIKPLESQEKPASEWGRDTFMRKAREGQERTKQKNEEALKNGAVDLPEAEFHDVANGNGSTDRYNPMADGYKPPEEPHPNSDEALDDEAKAELLPRSTKVTTPVKVKKRKTLGSILPKKVAEARRNKDDYKL